MNRKIYVGPSPITGKGVFARQVCTIGEPLFFLSGKLVTKKRMIAMGDAADVLIQVDTGSYVLPTHPSVYVNHSCNPSVGIRDDYSFVALRYLRKGDEITLDYSTTMLERYWTMDCLCKSKNCRSVVKDFDLLSPALQSRYLRLGVVQHFIMEYLEHRTPAAA